MFCVRYELRQKKQWIVERTRNVIAHPYHGIALSDINGCSVEMRDEGSRGIAREYHRSPS